MIVYLMFYSILYLSHRHQEIYFLRFHFIFFITSRRKIKPWQSVPINQASFLMSSLLLCASVTSDLSHVALRVQSSLS